MKSASVSEHVKDPGEGALELDSEVHGPALREVRAPVAVLVDGVVAYANPTLVDLLGSAPEQLPGTPLTKLLHPDYKVVVTRWVDEIPSGKGETLQMDLRLGSEEGGYRWFNARLLDARWDGKPAVAMFLSDMEDLRRSKRVEEQLRQAQKMEAVGRLAGGVAHDMNNVLQSVMGFASVLQAELDPGDPSRADVDRIIEACRKGRDVTMNLLGFARKGKYRLEQFTLNDRVRAAIELLKHTIPKKIIISPSLSDSTLEVHGDPTQIQHVIMNLCINAVDAMGDSGILSISTDVLDLRGGQSADYPDLEPDRYARLRITDTGPGMTSETIDMAFEPFFTTKPVGEGSGLGLPMVYGTVKNHGGTVLLESAPNTGTTVTVLLPTGPTPSQAMRLMAERRTPVSTTRRTVLLVDDEQMIRNAGSRLIEKLGYRVLAAADGREAIRTFIENRRQIAAILLDLVMPVMDGAQALSSMREIDADVPILLCSGYSKDEGAKELLGKGADAFIQKPFDLADLEQILDSVVDNGDDR